MVRATHSTLDNFGASGSGSRPPPPPPGLEELLATQNELLRQLVQGQQAISHFLQQQHFQLDGHKVHQTPVADYQELHEDTQEIKDVHSDSLMPPSQLPMKLKDDKVKCLAPKHGSSNIDLTGWEITCTKFVPRGKRQTRNAIAANTVLRARTRSPVRETMDPARCTIPENGSEDMPVMTSLRCKQHSGPSEMNRCFICRSPTHFARRCPQATQQNQDQGSSQTNKSMRKRLRDERKKQADQVEQGRINFTTLEEIHEGQQKNKELA